VPGREVLAQEQGEGAEGAALAAAGHQAARAAGSPDGGAPRDDRLGRPVREDPHLQLPAEPPHRSPDRPHDAPAPERDGRGAGRDPRRSRNALRSRAHAGRVPRGVVMTVVEAVRRAEDALARGGVPNARFDAEVLAAHALGTARDRLIVLGRDEVPAPALAQLDALVARRAGTRVPLQYLTGKQEFYSLEFLVDER